MFGWDFNNNRLLAVYVPGFFGGEVVASHTIAEEMWEMMDLKGYLERNA
jgi:hypothetical protein